jgi:DNA gyrase subunit B
MVEIDDNGKTAEDECYADVVLQYTGDYHENVLCFANSIPNGDGGAHLSGFRAALTRAFNNYAKANKLLKDKDPAITGEDCREGDRCRHFSETPESALQLTDKREARQQRG